MNMKNRILSDFFFGSLAINKNFYFFSSSPFFILLIHPQFFSVDPLNDNKYLGE